MTVSISISRIHIPLNYYKVSFLKLNQEGSKWHVVPSRFLQDELRKHGFPHPDTVLPPFVVRECLHAKVPVIASRVGGIPEIIKDGKNGLLFESGNYRDLASKLRFLVQNPKKLVAFRKRIQPVRNIVEDAEQLEVIYREILARQLKSE